LMREFNATFAYSHSDEITLVWLPAFDDEGVPRGHMFNGRVHKINSLLSAFASVRFNFHILVVQQFDGVEADVSVRNDFVRSPDQYDDDYAVPTNDQIGTQCETFAFTAQTLAKVRGFSAIFDSRLFSLPDGEHLLPTLRDYFAWRQNHDCRRNSTHSLARALFTAKQLASVSVPAMLSMLEAAGVHYEAMDAQFREGVFLRQRRVESPGVDRKTGDAVVVVRHRLLFFHQSIRLTGNDAELVWMTKRKDDDQASLT
jgi:tRNA(His) 5'-end guanylyltransferase